MIIEIVQYDTITFLLNVFTAFKGTNVNYESFGAGCLDGRISLVSKSDSSR